MVLDRAPQARLRAEVVLHQPGRHAGRLGDVANRRRRDPAFRGPPQRGLADAGGGREDRTTSCHTIVSLTIRPYRQRQMEASLCPIPRSGAFWSSARRASSAASSPGPFRATAGGSRAAADTPEPAGDFRLVDLDRPDTIRNACAEVDLVLSTVRHPGLNAERAVLVAGPTLLNLDDLRRRPAPA